MLRFLVDAQLPPELARRLAELGHEAIHVNETDLREAEDRAIWDHAVQKAYVVITKDADFVDLANLRAIGPPIIWVRLGNLGNPRLWARLAPLIPDIVERIERGARLIEIGR